MSNTIKVVDVLLAIDEVFPFARAFDGDLVGLLVGDGNAAVSRVLVTLDPGLAALARAQELGANLIVSHHPIRFNSFGHYNISHVAHSYPERVLAQALSSGIAIIAAHTNVDVAQMARRYWGDQLKLEHVGPLPGLMTQYGLPGFPVAAEMSDESNPYGEMWTVSEPCSLDQLAASVAQISGRAVKVHGDGQSMVQSLATATGSGGGRIPEAQVAKVDLLIAGEFGYHAALAAVESGLSLIEVGHDASELPLVDMIAAATGLSGDMLQVHKDADLWRSIEAGPSLKS